MANAYTGEAGSALTPHQQSQLNQLAACIGYGSQLIFSTEEKGGGKQVDGSKVNDKGEPETLAEQQRRLRRTRHGREEDDIRSKHDGQNLHQKKDETEAKKQSTGTADYTGTSGSKSPVARAPYMSESCDQFKFSPDSKTEEEEWDYRKARKIIGRHLRRMAQQEQAALLEESQKKARARGQGKAVRAKRKPKSADSLKTKKKRKPYTRKLKDPPKEQSSTPTATSSGKQDATVQNKTLNESTKNDESKSAVQREDDSGKGVKM
jgi:hypothetical protein